MSDPKKPMKQKPGSTNGGPRPVTFVFEKPLEKELVEIHDLWAPGSHSGTEEVFVQVQKSNGANPNHAFALLTHFGNNLDDLPDTIPVTDPDGPPGTQLGLNGEFYSGNIKICLNSNFDVESPIASRCIHSSSSDSPAATLFSLPSVLYVWRNDGTDWTRSDRTVYCFYENASIRPGADELYELNTSEGASPTFKMVVRKRHNNYDNFRARIVAPDEVNSATLVNATASDVGEDMMYYKYTNIFASGALVTSSAQSRLIKNLPTTASELANKEVYLVIERFKEGGATELRRHKQRFYLYRHA